jgi:SAM-dependent methyltransferase
LSDRKPNNYPADYRSHHGVFVANGAEDGALSYNDGDAAENYLLDLISKAGDRSLFAPEMLAGIRDWASLYHLSPKRANLLRPFADLLRGDVLEVGAGCGAVTRFLGENGGRITAVEGSLRRARIARHRTSDLTNVDIICDRIEKFAPSKRFDVATVIGVLEYAALYNPDEAEPHVSLLRCIRDLLTPHGVVILAIENRLGLKYFAGAHEDHTGRAFDSINDGYRQGSAATFGATELSRLLDRSGFRSRAWFVPGPDYKLPTTILSAPLIDRYPELSATLMAQTALADPQRPMDPTFSLEQGWSVLGRNTLLTELANSFLVVAGATDEAIAPYQHPTNLAWHYSMDRHPAFAKETRFVRSGDELTVERHSLTAAAQPDVPVRQVLAPEPLREGQNWWNQLAAILNKPDWSVSQVAGWARVWIDALARECGFQAPNGEMLLRHVDGRCFDLAPFNMVRNAAGETHFFDQEWVLTPTIEFGYLAVRGLRDSLHRVTSCAPPAAGTPRNVNQLVIEVLAELRIPLTRAQIDQYALTESQVQAWVQGKPSSGMSEEDAQAQWNIALKERVPAERDAATQRIAQLSAELDTLSALKPQLEAETARATHAEQERDAQARDASIAKAHAEELRATLLHQAAEIAALAPKPFSPRAALRAVGRPFARWKQVDYRHKAWEADAIRRSHLFSALDYLKRYPDVTAANVDPLLHYIRQGEAEGRIAHPLFDAVFYRKQVPETGEANMTALAHYASAGAAAGFDPHPLFDTDWYLQQNPDVAAAGVNPLYHYMKHGWHEGRSPHPEFDIAFYLAENPDVRAAGENPLVHYCWFGWKEGRDPHPKLRVGSLPSAVSVENTKPIGDDKREFPQFDATNTNDKNRFSAAKLLMRARLEV